MSLSFQANVFNSKILLFVFMFTTRDDVTAANQHVILLCIYEALGLAGTQLIAPSALNTQRPRFPPTSQSRPPYSVRWDRCPSGTHSPAARCNPHPPLTAGPTDSSLQLSCASGTAKREREKKRRQGQERETPGLAASPSSAPASPRRLRAAPRSAPTSSSELKPSRRSSFRGGAGAPAGEGLGISRRRRRWVRRRVAR
jgi:hypothetical protein